MDYLDKGYFNVLTTKVKTILDKTGASPWFEPALYNKAAALSAEEVHDNFQALVAGELNLNERTSTIEDSIVDASQNVSGGSIRYTGFRNADSCFYGGNPFDFLAPNDLDGDINTNVNLSGSATAKFHIAEGSGIVYAVNQEINDTTTHWSTVNVDFSGTKANLVIYLNQALKNNRLTYSFTGVNLASPGTRLQWGTTPKTFSISFNDEPYKVVTLSSTCADTVSAATYIQSQIRAQFPAYTSSFSVSGTGSVITFTADSSQTDVRLTSVRIREDPGMDVLGTANGIGWITTGSDRAIFDYSNSLEFYLSSNKMGIRGKGAYSFFAIKDDSTNKLFPTLKMDATFRYEPPYYQVAHTPYPADSSSLTTLNYSGILRVGKMTSAGLISGPISSTTATIETLNVTTLNASSVNIPNADITLNVVTGKGLYIKPTASTVNTGIRNALDGSIYVEGTVTAGNLAATTSTIGTLTVSTTASIAAATVTSLNVTNATIASLNVTGGSLSISTLAAATLTATTLSATTATSNNLTVVNALTTKEFAITKTDKAAGSFYTIALNTAVSTNPPSSNNTQAKSLAYDGWFAASKIYTGSTELTSARAFKKDITPFTESALDIINRTDIVSFRYKHDDRIARVGFIADDTHELLATPEHNTMEVGNSVGLLLKAVQELSHEVELLKQKTN